MVIGKDGKPQLLEETLDEHGNVISSRTKNVKIIDG